MSRLAARLERAIQLLGHGFIAHPANSHLRKQLRTTLSADDFYRQLTYVAYRIVFSLIAEDRIWPGAKANGWPETQGQRERPIRQLLSGTPNGESAIHDPTTAGVWPRLGAIHNALATDGDPRLDLPAMGGSFWSHASTPDLLAPAQAATAAAKPVQISDVHLVTAIRALAIDDQDGLPQATNFRSLGHQELGAAYECLLARKPALHLDARGNQNRFVLASTIVHARKTSGSYYTPDALVQWMLDAALDPAVREATSGLNPEQAQRAILDLKVCDPSCGAGYFLIAAARRLAVKLAQLRTGKEQPQSGEYQQALCDVITRCIYGVDINPMAVDLCRVGLWFESARHDLSFATLEQRIKCGNSVLGATPDLMANGIPDEAFVVVPGDDPKVVASYKARNKQERRALRSSNLQAVQPRADVATERVLADAWCAAFVWPKHVSAAPGSRTMPGAGWDAMTEGVHARLRSSPRETPGWITDEVARLAAEHRFFHWHLEFPDVFSGERDGFDVIIGNPPFLNQLEASTVTARGPDALIRVRFSGVTRGYTDLSATFLLLSTSLAAQGGRVALVQPQSLLAIKDAAPIRRAVLAHASLESLWVSNEHVFEAAGIFTCAPVLHVGGPRSTTLRRFATGSFTPLPLLPLDNDRLALEETWSHLTSIASGIPEVQVTETRTLGDIAEATADFRDQYYGLEGFLVEDSELLPEQRHDPADFPAILTSGLVDLCECHWGQIPTRILRSLWNAPRIDRQRMESQGTLGPWLQARSVPKVLLSTQTRVIEVLVDLDGRFIPSVPLITLTPKGGASLWHIAAALASPVCTALAMQRYAGAAMNADAIKLSAKQALRMPLPPRQSSWDQAADELKAATASSTPADRTAALQRYAAAACEAYGLSPQDTETLVSWWLDRLAPRARRRARAPRSVWPAALAQ